MPHSNPQDLRELPYGDDRLERTVLIQTDHVKLEGTLGVPTDANGIVLFAHGSGSSRFSPRNRFVARMLREAGLGTLLLDLLSRAEEVVDEVTRHHRFDISMLADRLVVAIDWLAAQSDTEHLCVGLFGASTGGGAALVAAARAPERVAAVVSRGGRPDLAGDALPAVRLPLPVRPTARPDPCTSHRARPGASAPVRHPEISVGR